MRNILFIASLLFFAACDQSRSKHDYEFNSRENIKDWKTFDQPNYSIQYPITWDLDQNGQMQTSFLVAAPLESKNDKFRKNVSLLIQDLPDDTNLSEFVKMAEQQIQNCISSYDLIESKRIIDKRGEYHRIIYSGNHEIFELKFQQHYWKSKDEVYILTFTCEEHKFDYFQELGEKILSSFVLKNNK